MISEVTSRTALTVQERFATLLQLLTGQELACLGGCPFLTLYTQMPQNAYVMRDKVSGFFRDQVATVEALLIEGIQKQEHPARTAQLLRQQGL